MSREIIKTIVEDNPFSKHIIFANGKYIALGNNQFSDLAKIGLVKKIKTFTEYIDGDVLIEPGPESKEIYTKIQDLYDPRLIGSFRIQSHQVRFLQKTIKLFKATHIKIYGDQDGIFVNFFDILRSISEARMNRKHETRLLVHQLRNQPVESFEITFNAGSFNVLPANSYHIGIGDNKVGIFTNDESNETYLFRDPEVVQPVIQAFSDRLGQYISLSLPATPSLLDLDTSQHEHPESGFDIEDF